MPDTLLRFEKPLDPDRLQAVLEGASMPTVPLPSGVDPDGVRAAVGALDPTLAGSAIDTELIEPLHRALAGLTRRDAADMRVWHYIACVEFPEVVWMRWNGQVPLPGTIGAVLTSALSRRFLGVPSLNGVSRNTFARLWWAAEALHDGEDYDMARAAIANQDLFQAIFERFFGIDPNAAVTCLERLGPESEEDRRQAARWLQQCLSTTVLESLSSADITQILDEALAT